MSRLGYKIRLIQVVAALTLAATTTLAQDSLQAATKAKKNTVSFIFSFHEFFDGNKMFDRRPENVGGYEPAVKGLEYKRLVGRYWGFEVSFRHCNHVYWRANAVGDLEGRSAYYLDLNLLRRIFYVKGVSLHVLAGVLYRHGGETVLAVILPVRKERFYDLFTLRDPGLNAGVRLQCEFPSTFHIPLAKNLALHTEAKFSQIIWRFQRTIPPRAFYENVNLSTRQMFTWQFGIGYRF